MKVDIQVSVYPLGTKKVIEKVTDAIQILKQSNVETFTSPMSTMFSCELEQGLETLGKMFKEVAKDVQTIMTVTVSNCCRD